MKTLQGILLSAACLAASQVHAQEPPVAAPQTATVSTLTFPPPETTSATVPVSAPPGQLPPTAANMGSPGPRTATPPMPQAQAPQPAAIAYPYTGYPTNYNNYGYSTYPYAYYPYYSYGQSYNPYTAQRMMPVYPQRPPVKQEKKTKPWGDTRYIWPDFYTDFTSETFDKMINAPYDMGRMPGGIRFPSISMPDPVTVSDAIANQVPPFAEEASNMIPADDMGNLMPFK